MYFCNDAQIQSHIPRKWKKHVLAALPTHSLLPPPSSSPSEEEQGDNHREQEPQIMPSSGGHAPLYYLMSSIKSLSTQGRLSEAFAAFSHFRSHCWTSSLPHTLSPLLSCSMSRRAMPQGLQLHALILSLGFQDHPSLLHGLTSFYTTLKLIQDAHAVIIFSNNSNVLNWNMVISAYVRDCSPTSALLTYKQMVERGVEPDQFTYPSVLKACSELRDLELGKVVHASIGRSSIEWSLFVQNALIAMYAKCGALDIARKIFDEMPERDAVSWNSIISGYASKGLWEDAFKMFDRMRAEGAEVNTVTWNTIVGGHLRRGNHREALRLISEVTSTGTHVDFVTLVVGLNACSQIGLVKLGKQLHGYAIRNYCNEVESVLNALISMYSRCTDIKHACILFRMVKTPPLVTWNTMISGFAISDQAEEASSIFRDMVYSGIQPNYVTVVTYLALCARVANLLHGRELHCYIIKEGFKGYRLLWNCLVDLYCKSARISLAQKVFDIMSDRDQVSYTSLIAGYGMQGDGTTALQLFYQMIHDGIQPDHVSMVSVLSACSHSGLVPEGQDLFDKMVSLYGITPHMEHYSCMVDLFARAGLVRKAEELLNTAPLPPTAAMWAALVGACHVHHDTEIGERAARRLLDMRTNNAGHYILIANMYAAAGCWQELAKVRTLMRNMGVRKAPALAWADLGNGFHPFLVGDRSNPLAPQIYEVLDGLYEQMSNLGPPDIEFGYELEG